MEYKLLVHMRCTNSVFAAETKLRWNY